MPLQDRFVDGFPADTSQPDYVIQRIIDGELRNCQSLEGTRALPGLRYPAYFAAAGEETGGWLGPALRRFAWHSGTQPWAGYLAGFLKMLVGPYCELTDETLLLLAKLGPQLQRNAGAADRQVNEAVVGHLRTRKYPLTPELIEALHSLVLHLVDVHCHVDATFDIAWRLWRAPENPNDGEPCFSARVRRDLRAMLEPEAADWSAFLDLRGRNSSADDEISAEHPGRLRRAVERIGLHSFASRLNGWIEWIESNQPAALSPVGRDLLVHLLHACRAAPALPIDEALYRLCGVRWAGQGNNLLTKEWLGALLVTLATRPTEKAFACAERLANSPDTSAFLEVRRLYDQLLAEVAGQSVPPREREGVDGYDMLCQPDLYRQQIVLDVFLRASLPVPHVPRPVFQSAWDCSEMGSTLVRRQATADPVRFIRAIASRLRWIGQVQTSAERGDDPHLCWSVALAEVQRKLLAAKPVLEHDDLIALVEADTLIRESASAREILPLLTDYTRQHGYSISLVEAIGRWHSSMHGSPAELNLRHRIGWLLWLEDVAPVRDEVCWSHRIRRDLRSMPGDSRTTWKALLENTNFVLSTKPTRKWERLARAALARVSTDRFRQRIRLWFEPFRAEEPLRLTVPGRDVLRNLMWHALVAQDPEVDEAVSWFGSAQWRTKRDKNCATRILPSFIYVMVERSPELAYTAMETLNRKGNGSLPPKAFRMYADFCARLGRKPSVEAPPTPKPPGVSEMLRSFVKRFANPSKLRVEGEDLVVTGVRDSYLIQVQESRITRRSDGRPVRLELDFSQPQFSAFRDVMDGWDLDNPFRPNYFRLMLCAQVLLRDDENAETIVAESE